VLIIIPVWIMLTHYLTKVERKELRLRAAFKAAAADSGGMLDERAFVEVLLQVQPSTTREDAARRFRPASDEGVGYEELLTHTDSTVAFRRLQARAGIPELTRCLFIRLSSHLQKLSW
jgi:hypothetical protein